jgi:glycosyltransferase involved in cell wall biosynthesis
MRAFWSNSEKIFLMPTVSFSIITPCLNAKAYLAEAIESVLMQHVPDVEHIIMDGGSTDGTLEILKKYPHLIVVSGPDNGMYDAINKGIGISKGEWIGLLNADDLYPTGSLKQVLDVVVQDSRLQAVNGGFAVFEDDGNERKIVRVSPSIGEDEFWYRIVSGSTAPNTWFLRRSLFESHGYYDSRYRYSADRELIMRLALAGLRPLSLQGVNYYFRQHEKSATFSRQDSRNPERGEIRTKTILESLNIQEEYLANRRVPAEMRKELRCSHSATAYKLAATALYHRKWMRFLNGVWRGCRYDLFWPVIFLGSLAKRLQKEFGLNAWT